MHRCIFFTVQWTVFRLYIKMLKIIYYNLSLLCFSPDSEPIFSWCWEARLGCHSGAGQGQAALQVVPDHGLDMPVLNLAEQGALTRNCYCFRQQQNICLLSDDQNLNNSSCTCAAQQLIICSTRLSCSVFHLLTLTQLSCSVHVQVSPHPNSTLFLLQLIFCISPTSPSLVHS